MSYEVENETPAQHDDEQSSDGNRVSDSNNIQQTNKYSESAQAIADSDWKQLRCHETKLVFSRVWVFAVFGLIAATFIPIGVLVFNLSEDIQYQEFAAYSDDPNCKLHTFQPQTEWGKTCIINYTIEHDFDPPIYFYYKLNKFYQNHRRYVKSREENQLENIDPFITDDCTPMETDSNDIPLLPCGLIAYSFFNDKFRVTHYPSDGSLISELCPLNESNCNGNEKELNWTDARWYSYPNWDVSGIAWDSDLDLFANTELKAGLTNVGKLQSWQNVTLPKTNDEDLIVWMRTAVDSTFTKLHRIIRNLSFKKGDILQVEIRNYFEVSEFDGAKSIVISSANALGGRNPFLGIAFIVVGTLAFIVLVALYICTPDNRRVLYHAMPDQNL